MKILTHFKIIAIILFIIPFTAATLTDATAQTRQNQSVHKQWSKIVELSDSRIKFEINDTDKDGGIQVFIDSDPWKWMMIFDPTGKLVFRSTASGNIGKLGGTEFFLETGEPPFDELALEDLLKLFPEGEYHFFGRGLEREIFYGSAQLTHNIADGPLLVSPLETTGLVDPDNAVVMWEPVVDPNGSPIIAYQVLVVQSDTGFPALPKVSLDVMMPATATALAVPPGFLLRDTEYEWEVLAIEAGGNQTLSSAFFKTLP